MSKVEHVARLIHSRDELVNRRAEVTQQKAELEREEERINLSIAAIDSEIDRAWQGSIPAPASPPVVFIPLRAPAANGHKLASVGEDFVDEDEDEDDDDEDAMEDSASHADRVLAMLRRSSVLDYGQAAIEIYNEDTPQARKRVRATLSYLKRSNRIRNRARNQWEVLMS